MKLRIEVDIPDDLCLQVVREMAGNWPECSLGVQCTLWRYDEPKFAFNDYESGEQFVVREPELLAGFKAFLEKESYPPLPLEVRSGQWALSRDEERWDDWLCACDADQFDALAQCCCHGEAIYA